MKPEVLAPAGTFEALEAGIKAGADAVYVGGSMFSARAFAGNFDKEEMLRAIDYCHFYGARLYIALNTLLKNEELALVPEYVRPFYEAGVDGIIVQDLGVVKVLSDNFNDLPLHASTQMSVSSRYGAAFLKEAGFTRVVPARELSLAETRAIKKSVDIEIESFVHGAMCFAYSGKCLLSSFIGGRSGNRGRCAQPCRQCYRLSDGEKAVANEYVCSLKDMCTLEVLPQLIDAGINSFKIEGRMKKPEYVAATVSAYRMAVDMHAAGKWDEKKIAAAVQDMRDIYNRGGFSTGYYFRQNGADMLAANRPNHTGVRLGTVTRVAPPDVFIKLETHANPQDVVEIRSESAREGLELTCAAGGNSGQTISIKGHDFKSIRPGMSVYRTRNNMLLEQVRTGIIEPERTICAEALVEAHIGKPITISIWDENASATVTGAVVSSAQSRPADEDTITSKMKKTGGTGVSLNVSLSLDDDAFIRMSELNNLRREAIAAFKEAKAKRFRRS